MNFLQNKFVKIFPFIVVIVLGLLLLSSFCVSFIGKSYINNNAEELLGRKVTVGKMSVNLFTGNISVGSFDVFEQDNHSIFVHIDKVKSKISLPSVFTGLIDVKLLSFQGLDVTVTQADSIYNFSDIIDKFSTEEETSDDSGSIPLKIENIDIKDSNIHYKDLVGGNKYDLNSFSLFVPGIDLSNLNKLGATLQFLDGGSLSSSVDYNSRDNKYYVKLDINKLNFASFATYIKPYINFDAIEGELSTSLQIIADKDHILNFSLTGTGSLTNTSISEYYEGKVMGIDSLAFTLKEFNVSNNSLIFGKLFTYHPYINYIIDKNNSNCFDRLFHTTESGKEDNSSDSSTEDSSNFKFIISDFEMSEGEITYSDYTIKPEPFVYNIKKIIAKSRNFDFDTINRITSTGIYMNNGEGRITFEGKINDLTNSKILVDLERIPLTDFSNYSVYLFGYPITGGTVNLSSEIVIKENGLEGINTFDFNKPTFAKKLKDFTPEINVPLKLGLYCIKNRKGVAHLVLPISGNIDKPEFSFKNAVFHGFGNLILKFATSPFRIFSRNHDEEEEYLDRIALSGILGELSAEETAKFDSLSSTLSNSEDIRASLKLMSYQKTADQEIAQNMLLRDYFVKKNPEFADIDIIDFDINDLNLININSPDLSEFANLVAAEKSIKIKPKNSAQEKAVSIYGGKKNEDNIRKALQKRIDIVSKYFEYKGLSDRVDVSYDIDTKKTENHYYKVELLIEE